MLAHVGVAETQYITTHSMRRGGTQYYQKIGMSLTWIMRKGGWSKHEHFERYLEFSNRKPTKRWRCHWQQPWISLAEGQDSKT